MLDHSGNSNSVHISTYLVKSAICQSPNFGCFGNGVFGQSLRSNNCIANQGLSIAAHEAHVGKVLGGEAQLEKVLGGHEPYAVLYLE
ncbi:MAG TPA: hypothetical protein VEH06_13930 [Candidatus Bathyarchaeia archaeon]|nr:hypothetical protein [Candidatus Bathyarchaeia archaeon]